jgi:(E)-4-hydroxy-3-methylbut-2-enyl-diphosphate synthase
MNNNIPTWAVSNPVTRRLTKEVRVGNVGIGGSNPVRVQSMTNTDTMETMATVEQTLRLVEKGCELVRITASNVQAAQNLYNIKNELAKRNCYVPLIADIHFNPKAAEVAAEIVEKVRINPGNYTDRNVSKIQYSDIEYQQELDKIAERLSPLIEICKKNNTAIRIGTNHGSLSQRIMARYGDTPYAMACSAMEFVEICKGLDFDNLVLSMKASNVKVMHYATRMLCSMMEEKGFKLPIHLGVTEAGNEMEGRVKSMCGIGSLLALGIGDTIRVSLTEIPENEIPVARDIVKAYSDISLKESGKSIELHSEFEKREKLSDVSALKRFDICRQSPEQIIADLRNDVHKAGVIYQSEEGFNQERLLGNVTALIMESMVEKLELCDESLRAEVLQATGEQVFKAEFIACPSCGRTKYDIQSALAKVKARCAHLKGLKIAVMGCIVNGPGEMADADYGYIGGLENKVHLYRGKTLVHSNIAEEEALPLLVDMIKEDGKWQNPSDSSKI